MENYIIHEKKIYRIYNNKFIEISVSEIDQDKDAAVAVLNADIDLVAAPEDSFKAREEVFKQRYTTTKVIQSELVAPNFYQVFSLKKKTVKEIYGYFRKDKLKVFIPYGVAVRDFLLQKQSILPQKKTFVCVDELDEKTVIITIISEKMISKSRIINVSSLEHVITEISRTQKSYAQNYTKRTKDIPEFYIVSSNQQYLDSALDVNLYTKETSLYVASMILVKQLTKIGKTPIQFVLPEVLIRQRNAKQQKTKLIYIGLSVGFFSIGFLIFIFGFLSARFAETKYTNLLMNSKNLETKIININQNVYIAILRKERTVNIESLYKRFKKNLPEVSTLYRFEIKKNPDVKKWTLKAIVTLNKNRDIVNFPKKGIWSNSKIENIYIDSNPAQRITLNTKY